MPEYWKFMLDPEMLGRMRSYGDLKTWGDAGWLWVSSKKCWQSQGIRVREPAFYGAQFEVPGDLDIDSQGVFLVFGAYGSGAANIHLNGAWIGYLPKDRTPDVTKKLKLGEKNSLVLGFLKTNAKLSGKGFAGVSGPGGLAGDVKLLSRKKE